MSFTSFCKLQLWENLHELPVCVFGGKGCSRYGGQIVAV